ncbi:GspI family T2SS minor pseudopilin variant LspI [Aurantivibrio infirmus]
MRKILTYQKGFTLIEVMVALFVVAIALPALMSQVVTQVDATAYIRDKTYANWVAQNQIEIQRVEYELTEKLLRGTAIGQSELAGRTWYWQIKSEQTAVPSMWRQSVIVGLDEKDLTEDNTLVSVVGFLRERTRVAPTN